MANNVILIKRTSVSGRVPNTSSSSNSQFINTGELALNLTDNKLFSSNGITSFEIGSNLTNLSVTQQVSVGTNTTVNNIIFSNGGVFANGSFGAPGLFLASNGSSLFWTAPAGSGGSTYVSRSYTANGTQTTFVVDTGYTPDFLAVYLNGVKLTGAEANVSSGTSVVFSSPPPANSEVSIVGFLANTIVTTANQGYQYTWTNTHTFANTVYLQKDLYANGSMGSNGQILTSNGSVVYWGTPATGSNTQIIFNDSGQSNGSGGFTFNKITNSMFVANTLSVGGQLVVSGNLIVSGAVTSVNVNSLVVNDNIIELADNNTNTDVVDTGWFSPAGNSSSVWYSGMARIASRSSNTNPYFWIFGSNTNPNTAAIIDTSSNSVTGTLQAYLLPYGINGAFVANSSAINIHANSTVSAVLFANSLTLTTALAAVYGGTGYDSYSNGDILYAGSTTTLTKLSVPASSANGQVLQITDNLPSYGILDGGTF